MRGILPLRKRLSYGQKRVWKEVYYDFRYLFFVNDGAEASGQQNYASGWVNQIEKNFSSSSKN